MENTQPKQNNNQDIENDPKVLERGSSLESPLDNLPKKESFIKELVKFALIAVIFVIPFRIYIAQPFVVNGASMDPTFSSGEYLIVDQISYRFEEPKRGSVIIFRYPKDPSKFFIKRIVGMPGETIKIENGEITITNTENPEGFKMEEPYVVFPKSENLTVGLTETEYFVMGDNRIGSSDSRSWGPLPEKNIVGRPFLRLLPINHLSVFPGDYSNSEESN